MPEAKRKAREAARRAAQQAAADAWQAKVDEYFSYLRTKYGFRIAQADASSWWQTRLIYQSDVAAVAVDKSFEFDRVEVSIMRLVDGNLPEYPIFILPDTTINEVLLDNLLKVRAPNLLDRLLEFKGLTDDQIEQSLAFLAQTLDDHAADALRGDFTVFAAIDALIKQHVKEHPQVIIVSSPERATDREVSRLVGTLHRLHPTIPVITQRYQGPPPRKRKRTPNDAP